MVSIMGDICRDSFHLCYLGEWNNLGENLIADANTQLQGVPQPFEIIPPSTKPVSEYLV